jgi:hypothetical protein
VGAAPSAGRGRGRGRGGGAASGSPAAVGNAQAGTEFNGEIREGREEARGSRKRQGNLGHWYAQLAADYKGAQHAGAAALKSVESTTSAQLAEAGKRSTDEQSELASNDANFASLVGGPKDSAGLAKIAEAAAAAGSARASASKPIASEQAEYVAQLGSDKAAARLKGIEARQEESARRDKLLKDVGAERKEKALARTSDTQKVLESDRAHQAEVEKLQLEKQEARTSAQTAAAETALAQIESGRKAAQQKITNRQEAEQIAISGRSQRATAKHYRAESRGGLTPSERNTRTEHAADAMAAAKALLGVKIPKSAKDWGQFQAALVEKLGSSYSADAVNAVKKLRAIQKAKSRGGYDKRVLKGKVAGPPVPSDR